MVNNYPFHYEVRFKLLAFDKDNNVRNESFTKIFNDKSPLESRANAFEEFNEYLSFLEQIKRLEKNNQGNFVIIQPSFINEILDRKEHKNLEDYFEFKKVYDQYKEEISVYLVVDDLDIAKNVVNAFEFEGKFETEFEIHKVSSFSFDAQDLVDNLEMHEIPLYEHFEINIDSLKSTVFHYGLDYAESGEEEDGAKRIILKTPFVWDTIERYNELYNSNQTTEKTESAEKIDLRSIIKRGESNQVEFKPCLLYNFKTQAAGIGVKYIIAKAICGFLNSNGGVLFIGVNDNGNVQGLENYDYSLFHGENEKDKLMLELDSLIAYFFDLSIKPLLNSWIETVDDKDILIINVTESHKPIFLKNKKGEQIAKEMYIRMNASTRQIIDNEELVEYVFNKQWKKPSR